LEERAVNNFDHPDSLDTDLLVTHLLALRRGEEVVIPTYDFATHTRSKTKVEVMKAKKVVLVEGILIFSHLELRDLFDVKVFVDTEDDIRRDHSVHLSFVLPPNRFIRRMQRDMTDRGRSLESVIDQYLTTVRPMHKEFVETCKHAADIVIPRGLNNVALDLIISRLRFAIGT